MKYDVNPCADPCGLLIEYVAQIAARCQSLRSGKPLCHCEITQYLLRGAWDIENSNNLQSIIWDTIEPPERRTKEYFETRYVVSKWVRELREGLDDEFFSDNTPYAYVLSMHMDAESLRERLRFFLSVGMNLESRAHSSGETLLLYVAGEGYPSSVTSLRVLLELGADYTATDYTGRGPLHLALPIEFLPRNMSYVEYSHWSLFRVEKLVLLLRAGCSVNAIDHYGRTPGDMAREIGLENVWMSALQEVEIRDDGILGSPWVQVSHSRCGDVFFNCDSHRLYVYAR